MRTALVGTGVLGIVMAVVLGGCVVGESPIVGEEAGGAAGTGGSSGTGGSGAAPGGGTTGAQPDTTGSTTYAIHQLRNLTTSPEDPSVCFPSPLPLAPNGDPTCRMYSATPSRDADGACACASGSQRPAASDVADTVRDYFAKMVQCDFDALPACDDLCVCEVPMAAGDDLDSCLNDQVPNEGAEGWCYVSPEQGVGDPALVSECPDRQKRRLRYLETGIEADALLALTCAGAGVAPPGVPVTPKPLGAPCVPDDERNPEFNGFQSSEVSLDTNAGCESNLCLVNHFQGRVSCPYGQTVAAALDSRECFIPGSDSGVAVTVPVDSQFVYRRADSAVTCSCRCAGPGPGPFCTCPSSMECAPTISALGLPSDDAVSGSYCIPRGTAYNAAEFDATPCDANTASCGDPNPY